MFCELKVFIYVLLQSLQYCGQYCVLLDCIIAASNCFLIGHWPADSSHYSDVIMGSVASQITSLTIVYSTVYSDADQRKHQSSASLAFVRGIHRGPVNSPHKWPVMQKMFPFDDVIMLRQGWSVVCTQNLLNKLFYVTAEQNRIRFAIVLLYVLWNVKLCGKIFSPEIQISHCQFWFSGRVVICQDRDWSSFNGKVFSFVLYDTYLHPTTNYRCNVAQSTPQTLTFQPKYDFRVCSFQTS